MADKGTLFFISAPSGAGTTSLNVVFDSTVDKSYEFYDKRVLVQMINSVCDNAGAAIQTAMIIAAALIEGATFFGLIICMMLK